MKKSTKTIERSVKKTKTKKDWAKLPPTKQAEIFSETSNELIQEIQASGEYKNDITTAKALRKILAMNVKLIAEIEKNFYKYAGSTRNIYALVKIVEQTRGIFQEMRGVVNSDAQIEHINEKIIVAGMRLIVQQFIHQLFVLKREVADIADIKTSKKVKDRIESFMKSQGNYMNDMEASMQAQVTKYLGN